MTMIGVLFGILLPLVGIWVTTKVLSAADQNDEETQS